MMKTALRVNKGLFDCQNVLGSVDCGHVKAIWIQFWRKSTKNDKVGDEHNILWLEPYFAINSIDL